MTILPTSTRSCLFTPSAANVLCAFTEISILPISTGTIGIKTVWVLPANTWNEEKHSKQWCLSEIVNKQFQQKSTFSWCTYVTTSIIPKENHFMQTVLIYSLEIPLLRPPKMKTSYLLKTLIAKFKLFFSSFSTPSVPLIRDHLWDCPKVVFKTTFGQSQRWS